MKCKITFMILLVLLALPAVAQKRVTAQNADQARALQLMDEMQQGVASLRQSQQAYQQSAEKMAGLCATLSGRVKQVSRPAEMKPLLEMSQKLRGQHQTLQQQMQAESRRYAALSKALELKQQELAKLRITQQGSQPQDLANLNQSQQAYQQAAEKMMALYSGMNAKVADTSTAAAAGQFEQAAAAGKQLQQMQEMNQSFNLQYLALQQKMQDESRRFTLLSNIMKTKHDTAKNSISNVR